MKTKFYLGLLTITALATSCSKDDDQVIPQPQAFTVGATTEMSTGTTSTAGTVSPNNFLWSEVKTPETTFGYTGTFGDRLIADDFTVPAGEKWNIENFYFYAYQTNFSGTSFPVNEFYYEIYASDPSVAGAVKIFGDATTNRYVSAETTNWYRILQGQTDGTTRKIYKMKIQALDLNLTAGTYWIKWGSKVSTGTHFYPQFPHNPDKNNNAKQFVVAGATWNELNDSGQKISFPFEISGTKLPN